MSTTGAEGHGGVAFQRSGVLLDRVVEILEQGPASTTEVAARALGVTAGPSIAARAVWALLGDDARFAVDADGTWSLREPPALPLRKLREEEWVVVDVETTGGSPRTGHRVTEVAAVRVVGGEVHDTYSTLINPRRSIPRMIMALTGITDEMVATAPEFEQIAPDIAGAIQNRIFVAHNAAFDWGFVTAEMQRATGTELAGRRLCTVRLARRLLPQLPSRSLDSLAHYFGLEIAARHRARDDAVATARIFLRLIEMLEERGIEDWAGLDSLLARRTPRRKRFLVPRSMDSA